MQQENTRIRELEQQVGILNRLSEISAVMNMTLDLPALLGYLMDAAAELTGSQAASVLLWDSNTRELRFAATTTDQSGLGLIGKSIPLQGSIAGTIYTENRIVQVDDAAADPRHYDSLDKEKQFQTRSLLGVPMTMQDRVIGVLEVLNKHHLPWTAQDRHSLSVLAAQAAIAIERARLIHDLTKANQELSELDKLKNDFIAIASHELRTPLGVILGYASFLQAEAEGRLNDHATKVIESGLQLRKIIEDLMNLRYLQQNPSELHRQTLPLSLIVDSALSEVASMVESRGHRLTVEPLPDCQISVDQIRSCTALTNVLNNAVRFMPDHGVVTLRAELRGAEVWVSVQDTGIGLETDQLERIFEKFYQVEDHMTRKHGGLGIGLSIARAMIEAQGGRVWASSPGLGKGSTFTLTFPLALV